MSFEKIMEAIGVSKKHKVSADGKVSGVHLLGLKSKNGYNYAYEAIQSAHKEYVGVDIYLNHDSKKDAGADRDVKDKIGFISDTYVREGVGMEGDVQLNPEHPYFPAVKWWIENQPKKLGFSHVAEARLDKATKTMVEIRKPKSADLVSNAATTTGIFSESFVEASEGIVEDKIQEQRFRLIWDAVQSLYYDLAYPMGKSLTDAEKALKFTPVLQDAIVELNKFNKVKESVMELEKLTIDELKKGRADLVAVIAKEAIEAELAIDAKVSEAIKDIPEKGRSKVFLTLVRESIKAGKDVAELVADRKDAFKVVAETTAPRKPAEDKHEEVSESQKQTKPKLSDEEVLRLVKRK